MAKSKLLLVFNKLVIFFTFVSINITNAAAEVNIDKTRLIINAKEAFTVFRLVNSGEYPTAIQLWTDTGDVLTSPNKGLTPVFVLPPIFKLNPGEIRQVKVMVNRQDLKNSTNESLFWLNILQIPQDVDDSEVVAKITLPLRYRLKILVRPDELSKPSSIDYKNIGFKIVDNQLHISNNTRWHMNFLAIQVGDELLERVTTPPLSVDIKPIEIKNLNAKDIRYSIISDEGQVVEFSQSIQ